MDEHHANTDQKKRRDQFFCQLAHHYLQEGKMDEDGWMFIPEATEIAGFSEFEITHFLKRLIEDGWIVLKDQAQGTSLYARLTSAGWARAQVICRDTSVAQ
jgi:hypothetical protein